MMRIMYLPGMVRKVAPRGSPATSPLDRAAEKRDEERRLAEIPASSLQAKSEPAEQTPAHDETQPEAKSLISW
jgi:hypothetical protein